jgi:hypothetical protein
MLDAGGAGRGLPSFGDDAIMDLGLDDMPSEI